MIDGKFRRRALCGVTSIGFLCLTTAAGAAPLTGEAFKRTHVGKCISYTGESVGTQCYHADGTMDYEDESYGTDTGTWSVKDDTICQEWSMEPGVSCTAFEDEGDGVYSDGGYSWTIN